MKKQWLIPLIIACLACSGFIFLGFQRNEQTAIPEFSNTPQRIISLAPNLTEILFKLGLEDNIIAVTNDSDYPPEAAKINSIGTFWQPDVESIIACRPDLAITLWFQQQQSVADTLSRLDYQVLTLKIETIDELFEAIEKIGISTGHSQQALTLISDIKEKLNNLREKFNPADKKRVLWVIQAEPVRIAGRNTFINEMIELAGGENAIDSTIQQYPPISSEEILSCNAEVIIQSAMGTDNIDKQRDAALLFWSSFSNLPAVKNNRIYVLDSDAVLRLGPRLPEGVEMIAHCLYEDIIE
jgi:iron complex transport system substrate-binding protein